MNPEAQAEVSRLEDYLAEVKRILDRDGLVVELDGIRAYAFNEAGGSADAEYSR